MSKVDLHPLSLGEILDRTLALYRQNFLLFVALAGIPQLPNLALSMVQLWLAPTFTSLTLGLLAAGFYIVLAFVAIAGYLFAQGGTVLAVSQLYLGRPTSIVECLRQVKGDLLSLLGVVIWNFLAVFVAFIFLIVPGIYVMCRLLVCVPVAIIEQKGPGESLSRSFQLTESFAGRAFVLLLFYWAASTGMSLLAVVPFSVAISANANNTEAIRAWTSLQTVVASSVSILLTPLILISTSIFYYDLRVRKEAFDLQLMMDPDGANIPRSSLRSVVPEGQ